MLHIKKYKREKIPKSQAILAKITTPDSPFSKTLEVQSSYIQNVKFCIFGQKKIANVCLFVLFFTQGWSY